LTPVEEGRGDRAGLGRKVLVTYTILGRIAG